MSSDLILRDDADQKYSYDNIKTQGWLDGQPVGVDAAVGFILNMAAAKFTSNDDKAAFLLRELAAEISKTVRPPLEEVAKKHKVDHPEEFE